MAAVSRHRHPPELSLITLGDLLPMTVDVVVSTVPAAAQRGAILTAVADVPVVFDVVYDPWPTPLAAAAAGEGCTVVRGLDLLLWQAGDQVGARTGRFDVPVAAMRAVGEAALAERAEARRAGPDVP